MRIINCLVLAFAFVLAAPAGTLVFDTISGDPDITVGGTPRTYMGQDFNAADPGGPLLIERVIVLMASLTTQSYTNIRASVQLWDEGGLISPAFITPAGPVQQFDLGPLSLDAFFAYDVDLVFATPIPLTGLIFHGIAINFKGDTGGGLADTDNLSAAVRYGAVPIAVGSNPNLDGSWRNASGRTDFNFNFHTDLRSIVGEENSALAIQIYAVEVPEPSTLWLAAGCLAIAASRRRRA
jgi:hypothetical protein